MIVGENARSVDLDVNIVKRRSSPTCARLRPMKHPAGSPRILNLEQAIEFIREDEFVETTPQSIRLRKKILQANKR